MAALASTTLSLLAFLVTELVARHDGDLREQGACRLPAFGAPAHVVVRALRCDAHLHRVARASARSVPPAKLGAGLHAVVHRRMDGDCHCVSSEVGYGALAPRRLVTSREAMRSEDSRMPSERPRSCEKAQFRVKFFLYNAFDAILELFLEKESAMLRRSCQRMRCRTLSREPAGGVRLGFTPRRRIASALAASTSYTTRRKPP